MVSMTSSSEMNDASPVNFLSVRLLLCLGFLTGIYPACEGIPVQGKLQCHHRNFSRWCAWDRVVPKHLFSLLPGNASSEAFLNVIIDHLWELQVGGGIVVVWIKMTSCIFLLITGGVI